MPSRRDGGSCVSPIAGGDAYNSRAHLFKSLSLSNPEKKKEVSYEKSVQVDKPIEPKVNMISLSHQSSTSTPGVPPSFQALAQSFSLY